MDTPTPCPLCGEPLTNPRAWFYASVCRVYNVDSGEWDPIDTVDVDYTEPIAVYCGKCQGEIQEAIPDLPQPLKTF